MKAATTTSLSPTALLRAAYSTRLNEDPLLTHDVIASRAGIPRPRVSEALSERTGEPHAETVRKILEALGFTLTLVDVGYEPVRKI